MKESDEVKQAIIEKYDHEAEELNTAAWLASGNDVRVPEPRAAHYFVGRKISMALKLCQNQISDTANVLEIGCSFGQMTALLARRFSSLTAVDISPKSVQIAEKRLHWYGIRHVRFTTDDAESLQSLPRESFDAVFSFSTIRFCPNPEKALSAIREKLRPGGIAVIDFPNRFSPWHLFVKPVVGIKPHIHDRLYSPSEATDLFRHTGFVVENVKRFLFTNRRLPDIFLPLSAAVDLVLERVPPFPLLAGIIMVKGRKK